MDIALKLARALLDGVPPQAVFLRTAYTTPNNEGAGGVAQYDPFLQKALLTNTDMKDLFPENFWQALLNLIALRNGYFENLKGLWINVARLARKAPGGDAYFRHIFLPRLLMMGFGRERKRVLPIVEWILSCVCFEDVKYGRECLSIITFA